MLPLNSNSLLQDGDLVFFRGTGPGAWLIRFWTKSPWSHVGMHIKGNLLEADSRGGVWVGPMQLWSNAAWKPLGLVWTQELETYALSHIGQPYGWLDNLRVAFGLPPKFRGFQCAELVAAILRKAGRKVPPAPTPGNLADEL